MSAANSAARKRPRTSGQPRAVEDQTAAVPGPGFRDAGENGSQERADADAGLVAVSRDNDAPVPGHARATATSSLVVVMLALQR